ncbi:MAG: glycosyltransferase [Solirubrobacterales bacterium]|nr:glycosyltransferase [Solirubrobacterales bacterium]
MSHQQSSSSDTEKEVRAEPLVSVIIAAHNGARFIRATIDSVLSQTYPHLECIVIDDASSDGTADILASFGSRIRVAPQTHSGYVRARNHGVSLARGSLLSFLDHDDYWSPTKLERQVQRLSERPDSAVIYTAVELVDESGRHLRTMPAPPREVAFRNTILMESPILFLEQGALIRRQVFDELGGFDERLSTSTGCDLACRLALRYAIEPIDEPLVSYRQHSGQMSHDLTAVEHDMRLVHQKLLDGDQRLTGLARHARYNLHVMLARWYWHGQKRRMTAIGHLTRAIVGCPRHATRTLARRTQRA